MFNSEDIKNLNELELNVYNYVISNMKKTTFLKIRELAEATHVSTTTILKFCKKVGCDGYSEFKMKLKEYIKLEKQVEITSDVSEIINFFRLFETDNYKIKFNKAVDMVYNSKQVIFIGVGNSACIGMYAARYFSNIGKFSLFISDPFYPIKSIDPTSTLIVLISTSGETVQTIELLNKFKALGCKSISITNSSNCTIARMSDCSLTYYINKVKDGDLDLTSHVPMVFIVEELGKSQRKKS